MTKRPGPCEHPPWAISWDQTRFCVVCEYCAQEVTLRVLAEHQVATLDRARILAYAAAEQQGTRENRSMMVIFRPEEWEDLLKVSSQAGRTPEQFVETAARRAIRTALRLRD